LFATRVFTLALAAALSSAASPPLMAQVAVAAPAAQYQTIAYGPAPLQSMDFHAAQGGFSGPRPLILFIHGGAWVSGDKSDSTGPAKIRHYTDAGYHFATINYRLLPEAMIEDQAADVAFATAALLDQAAALNIDTTRLVLMGHSAGAHLAALASTDPRYLQAVGLGPQDIAGTVLIDGPAFDVPVQIRDAGPLVGFGYELGFGSDPVRQRALSPVNHAQGPNARAMLMLHVERDSARQARLLAEALERNGTPARVEAFPGRGMTAHNEINSRLGRSDFPATSVVDEWLHTLLQG
jgi:arylformamidase